MLIFCYINPSVCVAVQHTTLFVCHFLSALRSCTITAVTTRTTLQLEHSGRCSIPCLRRASGNS